MGYVVKITREPGKGAMTKTDAIAEALLENGKIAEKIINAMRKKTRSETAKEDMSKDGNKKKHPRQVVIPSRVPGPLPVDDFKQECYKK